MQSIANKTAEAIQSISSSAARKEKVKEEQDVHEEEKEVQVQVQLEVDQDVDNQHNNLDDTINTFQNENEHRVVKEDSDDIRFDVNVENKIEFEEKQEEYYLLETKNTVFEIGGVNN